MMEIGIIWGEIKIRILPNIARLKITHIVHGARDSQGLGKFYITSVKRQIAANIFYF